MLTSSFQKLNTLQSNCLQNLPFPLSVCAAIRKSWNFSFPYGKVCCGSCNAAPSLALPSWYNVLLIIETEERYGKSIYILSFSTQKWRVSGTCSLFVKTNCKRGKKMKPENLWNSHYTFIVSYRNNVKLISKGPLLQHSPLSWFITVDFSGPTAKLCSVNQRQFIVCGSLRIFCVSHFPISDPRYPTLTM